MGLMVAMIGGVVVGVVVLCVALIVGNRQRALLGEVEQRRRWERASERYLVWWTKYMLFVLAAQVVLIPLIVLGYLLNR